MSLKSHSQNSIFGYVGERLNPLRCQRRECQFKSGRNRHTPLVQLGEYLSYKQGVGSSSLSWCTIYAGLAKLVMHHTCNMENIRSSRIVSTRVNEFSLKT